MRSTWMGAALALIGLVGCGGGGDDKRTYLACTTAEACLVMESDVPMEMSCTAAEVPSCATSSVLGTCQIFGPAVRMTMYVYASERLSEAEQECTDQNGIWTLTP